MSEIENITDNDLDTAEYIDLEDENGDTVWKLDVETYRPKALHMKVKR